MTEVIDTTNDNFYAHLRGHHRLTPQTVELLLGLLDRVTLQASAPDFEQAAAAVVAARRELTDLQKDTS